MSVVLSNAERQQILNRLEGIKLAVSGIEKVLNDANPKICGCLMTIGNLTFVCRLQPHSEIVDHEGTTQTNENSLKLSWPV